VKPNVMSDLIDRLECEIRRLTTCLKTANDNAERFEREWYLRGDALEQLGQWAEAYPVENFPEPLPQDWQRANALLAENGISMSSMSASNMRHVINGVRQIVDDAGTLEVHPKFKALEADAVRYRWLRDHLPPGTMSDMEVSDAESWDAAVDAGMTQNGRL
jgi:hypothetical protein